MELSKRLLAVASLVTPGSIVADIGTDHGYNTHLAGQKDPAVKLIAMDVNEGPLERAREHILAEGLSDRIDLRLSDGFSALDPGEVHTIIAAGMGGGLVIHILEANPAVTDSVQEFILSPSLRSRGFGLIWREKATPLCGKRWWKRMESTTP